MSHMNPIIMPSNGKYYNTRKISKSHSSNIQKNNNIFGAVRLRNLEISLVRKRKHSK